MQLKILSYNIHKGAGWRLNSTMRSIQLQVQEVNSDIIFLQEMRGHQGELFRSAQHPYLIYGKNAVSRNHHHGNAILSKFPMTFSNNLDISMHKFEHRGLLHSIISLDTLSIHLLCTHLSLFEKYRRKQLEIIEKYIIDNIPVQHPIILGGDFNDWSSYATKHFIHHLAFQEVFLSAHNSYAKTFPSFIPILKLDRMYVRGFTVNYANKMSNKYWRYLSDHIAIEASLTLRNNDNHTRLYSCQNSKKLF